jgi:phosphatidate cytidylyltransferase
MTWKRVATAAVLIPLVVGLVLWGSTAVVALATALIVLLALFEYFSLGDAIGHRAYRFWTAVCALALIYVQLLWTTYARLPWAEWGRTTVYVTGSFWLRSWLAERIPSVPDILFLFLLGVSVLTLWTKRLLVEALPAAGISSSALLLVALPLTYAIRLHGIDKEGPYLLLFALVIIWVADTVAYFVGRAIGKHPLAPHLSPKKTWEGTIASFLGSLAIALAFTRWLNVPIPHLLGMAAAGNIAGQIGDLLESAYKRSAGVKDSGGLLPGHGGVLDRIDALILAFPVVWYYWVLVYSPGVKSLGLF